jgi:CRP-like cAMP-binding protein
MGETLELAMLGNEGMVGVPVILRNSVSPYQIITQISADALRIKASALRKEFDQGCQLQDLLLRYTHSLFTQVCQSALCYRFHKIKDRLCRWLLIIRDRVHADNFQLTQEFISEMLAVPRSSLTVAALHLQDAGIIHYRRGKITILNHQKLEANSCGCYQIMKREIGAFLVA